MHRYSKAAWFLSCLLIILTGFFYYPKWEQKGTEATISWDVSGYYMYLPAAFIYKDLKQCNFRDEVMERYRPTPNFEQAFRHESGNFVMKYSCGQAILMSPFFFTGHLIAGISANYPADGFSYPYQISIGIGMLLYSLVGLWLVRKILLLYFSDTAVAMTILALALGSNYFNYAAIDGAMTHSPLFTVYALLVYLTISFYRRHSIWKAVAIGCLIGLATLTRPTEIISALIPLLWGIGNKKDLKERIRWIGQQSKYFITAALFTALIVSIQIAYWKIITGSWVVYSYQNEKFSFLKPHLKECFVGYRSGWLVYSPIMILSILGFVALYKKQKNLFWPVFIFCFLFTYICFSWDIWWYGGSLGQRAMIQSYPMLAFPMAALIQWIFSGQAWLKIVTGIFIAFCIWFNLWLTHQGHRGGLLRVGEMTRAYFWAIFGRSKVDERVETLLDNSTIYRGEPENPTIVYQNDFETDTSSNAMDDGIDGRSIYLDANVQFSTEYFFQLPTNDKKWIRASADFWCLQKEWTFWKMAQFMMRFYDGDKLVTTKQIRVHRVLSDGETKNLLLDVKMPRKKFDRISISFWNAGGDKKIIIDNLKVIAF